jgi:hypothetical protein
MVKIAGNFIVSSYVKSDRRRVKVMGVGSRHTRQAKKQGIRGHEFVDL